MLILTNTAPFSMSGTTMGAKPCYTSHIHKGVGVEYAAIPYIVYNIHIHNVSVTFK